MLPRSRAMKDRVDLRRIFDDYFAQRSEWLAGSAVSHSVEGVPLRVRMNRARLLQVIDNLVRNSVYWLGRGSPEGRSVHVELVPTGFILSDTGPGVDPVVEETLFDLFVTMRSHEDGGQGLGLFISAELLALDGCSIVLLPDRNPAGRRFKFAVDLSPLVEA